MQIHRLIGHERQLTRVRETDRAVVKVKQENKGRMRPVVM